MTGAELKTLRKSTGLTQDRFATLVLDVTPATVCRMETEVRPINPLKADGIRVRVAEFLKCQKG